MLLSKHGQHFIPHVGSVPLNLQKAYLSLTAVTIFCARFSL